MSEPTNQDSPAGTYQAMAEHEAKSYPGSVVKLLDDTGRIRFASESHAKVLGLAPEALVGRELKSVIAPSDVPHSDISIQDAVLNTKSVDISINHAKAGGGYQLMRRKTWGLQGDEASRYYVMTRSTPVAEQPA